MHSFKEKKTESIEPIDFKRNLKLINGTGTQKKSLFHMNENHMSEQEEKTSKKNTRGFSMADISSSQAIISSDQTLPEPNKLHSVEVVNTLNDDNASNTSFEYKIERKTSLLAKNYIEDVKKNEIFDFEEFNENVSSIDFDVQQQQKKLKNR